MTKRKPPDEPPPEEPKDEPGGEVVPFYRHPPGKSHANRNTGPSDEQRDRCVLALRGCAYVKDACMYAGIKERRYHEWVARGWAYDEHLEEGGKAIEGEDVYRRFAIEVDQARSEARVAASMSFRRAFDGDDWRAAAKYLAVTDPQHWAEVKQVEMSGRDGGPIEIEVTASEMELAESIEKRPLRIEDAIVVSHTVTQAAAYAVTEDDDEDDYDYLIVPSTLDYDEFLP